MEYNTRGQDIAQQLLCTHTWRTFSACPWDLFVSMKNDFLVQAKLLVLGLLSSSAGLTGFPNYWISNQRNSAAHLWWWSTHFLPCCILFFQLSSAMETEIKLLYICKAQPTHSNSSLKVHFPHQSTLLLVHKRWAKPSPTTWGSPVYQCL